MRTAADAAIAPRGRAPMPRQTALVRAYLLGDALGLEVGDGDRFGVFVVDTDLLVHVGQIGRRQLGGDAVEQALDVGRARQDRRCESTGAMLSASWRCLSSSSRT